MKIYTISDDKAADDVSLLLRLNADCARLHWSRSINHIPTDVMEALETIEIYIESKVAEICGSPFSELTDDEENQMLRLIKTNPVIKTSLGKGVVLRGQQAREVAAELKTESGLDKICGAIESGNNIILF